MNKRTVNFIELLNNDPLTKLIVSCWANALDFNDFEEMVEQNDKFKNYHYSEEMFNLICNLLDEQYELDMELYIGNQK